MSKRTLDGFFTKIETKKPRIEDRKKSVENEEEEKEVENSVAEPSKHESYPFPIRGLPNKVTEGLNEIMLSEKKPKHLNDKPDLDVLYYKSFLPHDLAKQLYLFIRGQLFFYRVEYPIKRDGLETVIKTPRYTTVFGMDSHSYFHEASGDILDSKTRTPAPATRYSTCRPRPIPSCLLALKHAVELLTDTPHEREFNFVLVNYYADVKDSISYHSDDEPFLGPDPTIGSMSLGTTRDFLLKNKADTSITLRLPLDNGDLLIMKGTTQPKWLHSIPKRSSNLAGGWAGGGRINLTFRRNLEIRGTHNYYRYNVGKGPVYTWDDAKRSMEKLAEAR